MKTEQCDVCIIGAGPAGSAAAIKLAQLGYDVLVVERDRFPRRKIGESLPPTILPILDILGVAGEIENAGFPRPERAFVKWLPEVAVKTRPEPFAEPGFQADRAFFDAILLDHAREKSGVRVWMSACAHPPSSDNGENNWAVTVDRVDGRVTVSCRFIIDCAGRRGCVPDKRQRLMPPTIALYAYWQNHQFCGYETRVDTADDKWFWAAPLSANLANAAVLVDSRSFVGKKANLGATYRSLLAEAGLIAPCLRDAHHGPVQVCSATAEISRDPIGTFFIRAGESALAVDPLSSQGTSLSLVTGLQAAIVANTLMSRPINSAIARQFYLDQLSEWSAHYARISAGFYAQRATISPGGFWTARSQSAVQGTTMPALNPLSLDPDQPIKLSPQVQVVKTGVLEADQVVQALALTHPNLRRPIALIGDILVETVLPCLQISGPALLVAASLSSTMGEIAAISAVQQLWANGIFENDLD